MAPQTTLAERLEEVRARIARAADRTRRDPAGITLIAVTKVFPAAVIREAWELGVREFGENYVQEFQGKFPHVAGLEGARFHLIGHLQSNKSARAAELFDAVDSLDSLRLAERLNEAATKLHKHLPVLIEVKLSAEETKSGLDPESREAAELLERLPELANLRVQGLMTIAPWGVAEEVTRACFGSLREWRDRWAAHPRLKLDVLSMGMSGDFGIAIEEGATRIRIGTALFGKRKKPEAEEPEETGESA